MRSLTLPPPPPVLFKTPTPEETAREGYLAADLHVHTNHSDSFTRVRDLLRSAARQGIGCAVTDHNQVRGAVEACHLASGVPVIPGIEVSADDGPHLLFYFPALSDLTDFYRRHIERKKRDGPCLAIRMTTAEILDAREDYHCVAAEAHPCGYAFLNRGMQEGIECGRIDARTITRLDAIEVICGGMARPHNLAAADLACTYGLGRTGGTDSHLLREFGGVVTCAEAGSVEEFLEAIVRRRSVVIGRERNLAEKAMMGAAVLPHHLPYALPILRGCVWERFLRG
ncbi:putative metal-dependent phosphoesterase TrpH [Methanofollis sp. W23]|uniref:PHP domain-containing protein n=1 Tax=Methanofollis sp. W23 TaxID=2817849 RepID=UPI001AEA0841|nr:PHP-associated domain-containing protein [Methanofollis sp. W23]MBP2145490.1 putative metal-dependent phosphoesterase TrpH [Methanofollis sp. W23]